MKKVCHVQLLPMLSGAQRVSLDEFENLRDNAQFYLICQCEGELTVEARKAGVEVLSLPALCREISLIKDMKSFFTLFFIFRKNKFDVVHTHSSKTGVLGRVAARMAGVPCVIHTVHGFAFSSTKSKFKKFFYYLCEWFGAKFSHVIICLHEEDKKICVEKLRAASDIVSVQANGVNVDKFFPSLKAEDRRFIREKLLLPENRKIILMVGRLWEQKNPTCLLNAYSRLWEDSDPEADLVFVGDGELQDELLRSVGERGLEKHVHFMGWRSDTPDILRASDIFVLPSRWEGMPLAILEAMSSGLPVIASNIPGNHHLVDNGLNGILFPSESASELSIVLREMLDNENLCYSMGIEGRRKILAKHNIFSRTRRILGLYEKA